MSFLSQRLVDKLAKYEQTGEQFSDIGLAVDLGLFSIKHLVRSLINSKLKSNRLNVGLVFNGGIGDQVIQLQWARIFVASLQQQGCNSYNVFMFANPELGQMLLNGVDHVDQVENHRFARKHDFDLLLSIEYFPRIWKINNTSLSKYAPFLTERLEQAFSFYAEFSKLSRTCYHYQLMQLAVAKGWTRYDLLGRCGLCDFDRNTVPFLQLEDDLTNTVLQKFNLQNRQFITLHSGISGIPTQFLDKGVDPVIAKQNATRTIPLSLLEDILVCLKQQYPDYLLVHIGDKDALPVQHADLNLAGKTSLKESLCLLSKSACHIDNDAGLIHLRHAMGLRSVVVWGPTLGAFVGYPEDINIQGNCTGCMWLTPNWESHCPKGYACAKCIYDISAEDITSAVQKVLQN